MHQLTHPSPVCITKSKPGATDKWLICDASEMPGLVDKLGHGQYSRGGEGDWTGHVNYEQAKTLIRTGDLSIVAKTDAMLQEVSHYMPLTARRGYAMDIVGAVPSVPDYLSGNPVNMRRRIRTKDEYAPLVIFYDSTCSANIATTDMFKRGLTVLALVRALSGLRPIELWTGGGLNTPSDGGGFVAMRIETAPLDLARAAWCLTSAAFTRGICYGLLYQKFNCGGGWPYQDYSLTTRGDNFRDIVQKALPHAADVLALPAVCSLDELCTDPRAWLARTFTQLAGQQEDA